MFPCLLSIVVLQDCSYVSVNLPQILKLVYVVAVAVGYSLQSHCQTDAFVEDSEMNSQVKSIVPCAASGQAPLEFCGFYAPLLHGFPNILFFFLFVGISLPLMPVRFRSLHDRKPARAPEQPAVRGGPAQALQIERATRWRGEG